MHLKLIVLILADAQSSLWVRKPNMFCFFFFQNLQILLAQCYIKLTVYEEKGGLHTLYKARKGKYIFINTCKYFHECMLKATFPDIFLDAFINVLSVRGALEILTELFLQ